jgi:hypothetical protein
MKDFENQNFFRRYARQDDNKGHIVHLNKLLDESIVLFGVSFLLVVLPSACTQSMNSGELATQRPSATHGIVPMYKIYIR